MMRDKYYEEEYCHPDCPGSLRHTTDLAVLKNEFETVKEYLKRIEEGMVTRGEFTPIQRLVYGAAAVALMAIAGAILALVLKGNLV